MDTATRESASVREATPALSAQLARATPRIVTPSMELAMRTLVFATALLGGLGTPVVSYLAELSLTPVWS